MYAPSVNYPIPLGYIPLYVHTLPTTIANGAKGGSSVERGQGCGFS